MKAVEIAAGIIERGAERGRPEVLVARRPEGVHLAGLFEFPGGKVRAGESPAHACARECREELGADVVVLGLAAPPVVHAYPDRTVTLSFFRCALAAGSPEPRALASAEVRWVERARLRDLPWPEANLDLVARLASDVA
ncbi:MAG TPA: (deoxy)nucleoside triphosphate pyrophosphohydrolase [Planctomycetota bacterium]|nr:(deoxy)nucleoside triphosphate pyrophosphohydrolase [Planctomycetota bacterium]